MTTRYEALAAIARNPGAPLDELAPMIKTAKEKAARQAILDCKKNGLVSVVRDDVTGLPGYVLTQAGKDRLAAGPESKQGSNMVKGQQFGSHRKPQPAAGNNTGSGASVPHDAEGAAVQPPQPEHPADPPTAGPAAADDTDLDDEPMPDPDPVLLASANRMLSERLAGVAHALRGSGLEGLKNVADGDDLQTAVAALTGAYQIALSELQHDNALKATIEAQRAVLAQRTAERDNERALTDKLKHLLDSKTHECEGLRAQLEAIQAGAGAKAENYAVMLHSKAIPTFSSRTKAQEYAELCCDEDYEEAGVYAVTLLGAYVPAPKWVPA